MALTAATRRSEELTLGASPRATLHLVRAAKAMAAMHGRDYVLPDDVHAGRPVLAHRLLPSVEAAMSGARPRPSSTACSPASPSRGPVREALSGLTVRGRAFIAAGVTAIVCAILQGQPELTRVGVLVLSLPLITAAVIVQSLPARARPHRQPQSSCRPARPPA